MEIIESVRQRVDIKIPLHKSLAARLDSLKKESKKQNATLNFNFLMETYAEKLIAQAEEKLKALA